jgi:hypothetical protein
VVQKDCVLPPGLCAGGIGAERGLALKHDDQVVCVSRPNAVSPESEWGVDAPKWDHTRFLDGRAKGVMNPFGGGVSMCEGESSGSCGMTICSGN